MEKDESLKSDPIIMDLSVPRTNGLEASAILGSAGDGRAGASFEFHFLAGRGSLRFGHENQSTDDEYGDNRTRFKR
jgi:hypothetical protein